jgi:hypothetical protein
MATKLEGLCSEFAKELKIQTKRDENMPVDVSVYGSNSKMKIYYERFSNPVLENPTNEDFEKNFGEQFEVTEIETAAQVSISKHTNAKNLHKLHVRLPSANFEDYIKRLSRKPLCKAVYERFSIKSRSVGTPWLFDHFDIQDYSQAKALIYELFKIK